MTSTSGACVICARQNPLSKLACEGCGARLPWVNSNALPQSETAQAPASFLAILGLQIACFLLPIVGIVLYFFYRTSDPTKSIAAIRAAALGITVNLILLLASN